MGTAMRISILVIKCEWIKKQTVHHKGIFTLIYFFAISFLYRDEEQIHGLFHAKILNH